MKKLSVIIVNWNGCRDTLACLHSLKKIVTPPGITISVIVVDNGSSDESVVKIRKEHPWVQLIEAGKNLGFTGGNNLGIQLSLAQDFDYVWLLNNDTVVDKNALRFLSLFKDEHVGIIGTKIYFAKGHEYHKERYSLNQLGHIVWFAGGIIDWNNMYASHRGVDEVDDGQYDTAIQTDYITGCSMCVRIEVIKKIGLLDHRFFMYLEDLDYCLRAKKFGFDLMYSPAGVVWHVNAGSAGGSGSDLQDYFMTRNRMIIGFRYAPIRTRIALLREAIGFLYGDNRVKKQAIKDFFTQRWGNQYATIKK